MPITGWTVRQGVEEVLTVSDEPLEDVPIANSESIEAIAKIDDRLVVLLNTSGLFAREVEEPAAAAPPRISLLEGPPIRRAFVVLETVRSRLDG